MGEDRSLTTIAMTIFVTLLVLAAWSKARRRARRTRQAHAHTPEYWRMMSRACEARWSETHPTDID